MALAGKVIVTNKVATPEGNVNASSVERQVEVLPTKRQGQLGQVRRAQAFVWLATGAIMILIAFRFGLMLLGANAQSGFAQFIYGISHPVVAPFLSLFHTEPIYGRSILETSTLVAFIVYPVIALLINKVLSVTMTPTDPSGQSYE